MEIEMKKQEMADAAFIRGEEAFRKGRYQDTVDELTRCLSIEKNTEYQYLEENAYNMLGMLFSFVGYETNALDHYLSAFESAEKCQSTDGMVSALLNIGLLFQGCKEYGKAMNYYRQAKETAESDLKRPDMRLILYSNIQIAQLLCRMGRYEDALHMQKEIDNYYLVTVGNEFLLTKCILDIYLAEYQNRPERVRELLKKVIKELEQDLAFIEQIDFYVDICEFMFERQKNEEMRMILNVLQEKLRPTELFRLQMRLEGIEVSYQKKCGEEADYLNACRHFMILRKEYEDALQNFRRKNLKNIESLQKLEQRRRKFEKRSKCDLVTGLLNKTAFEAEVEEHLSERAANVTDAMAFIDIDDFKLANDSFGHLIGDEIIRTMADKIQQCFSERCICGRFGGDEFTVFVKEVQDMSCLEEQVENFREEFSKIGFGRNHDLHMTVSIGISYNHSMKASYQTLVSCADEALEKAKEYGKNRVTFYEVKRGIYKHVERK